MKTSVSKIMHLGVFSKNKMKRYLNLVDKKLEINPTPESVEKLFLLAVEDFKNGEISVSELSGVCNYLWPISLKIQDFKRDTSELSVILLVGAEMEYYLKDTENKRKENSKIFDSSLKEILSYKSKLS